MKRLTYAALALGVLLGFTVSYLPDASGARNSGGTYSLPNTGSVPNPVVTGTTITTNWANGTLSDLASEMTNSLDRTGRGCMTGQLQSASGTSSAPGITFCSDVSSGFWRAGDDDIRFGVDSAENLQFLKSYDQLRVTLVTDAGINANTGYTNTNAIDARGNGTGSGISATGGTTGPGGTFANGTAAVGATARNAVALTNGYLSMAGVTDPNQTVAFTDVLTTSNMVKAWANCLITTGNGGGNFTVTDCSGFNVASVARASSTQVVVTIADDFSSSKSYAASVGIESGSAGLITAGWSAAAGTFTFHTYNTASAVVVDLDATGTTTMRMHFQATGIQ